MNGEVLVNSQFTSIIQLIGMVLDNGPEERGWIFGLRLVCIFIFSVYLQRKVFLALSTTSQQILDYDLGPSITYGAWHHIGATWNGADVT